MIVNIYLFAVRTTESCSLPAMGNPLFPNLHNARRLFRTIASLLFWAVMSLATMSRLSGLVDAVWARAGP